MPDFNELLKTTIILWTVIDPLGTVPVFIAVTKSHPDWAHTRVAILSCLVAFSVLLFFLVVGQILLESMNIPLVAFQVSGGIVLFLFALEMIFGSSKPDSEMQIVKSHKETAVYPLGVPSIASPGAILAIMLLTDNHRFSISHQLFTGIIMACIILITLLLLLSSRFIHKLIGDAGASIISRIMGLLLSAVAANSVLEGILSFLELNR